MTSIGFIGVGAMGAPMTANLMKAGFSVCLYDADRPRADALAKKLGCTAGGLSEVAACDIIVTMLPDGQVVSDVLRKANGGAFLESCRPGTVVIDMSSSEPAITRETGAALKARGVAMIDAPVSGGVPRATTGSLAIMIGCDDKAALERARPVLSAMGTTLFEVGPLGAGHAMKALNNFAAAASYAAVSEALAVGRANGLAPETVIAVMNASTGRSFVTEFVMKEHVITGRFSTGFAAHLLAKDARIAGELGAAFEQETGEVAPVMALVRDRWAEAHEALGHGHDHSEAIRAWYPDMELTDGE